MGTKGDSLIVMQIKLMLLLLYYLRCIEVWRNLCHYNVSVFMMPKAKKLWEDLQLNKTSRFYKLLKDISKISNDKSFYFSRAKFGGISGVYKV